MLIQQAREISIIFRIKLNSAHKSQYKAKLDNNHQQLTPDFKSIPPDIQQVMIESYLAREFDQTPVTLTEDQFNQLITENYNPLTQILNLENKLPCMPLTPLLQAIVDSEISPHIHALFLANNNLFGNMDWNLLPTNLKFIDIADNHIFGTIHHLPPVLEVVYVRNNRFSDVDWSTLSESLELLTIQENPIDTEIEWNVLPEIMDLLVVSANVAEKSMYNKPKEWVLMTNIVPKRRVVFQKMID